VAVDTAVALAKYLGLLADSRLHNEHVSCSVQRWK